MYVCIYAYLMLMCFCIIYIATYPLHRIRSDQKLVVKSPPHLYVKGKNTDSFFHIQFSNTILVLFLRLTSKLITKYENSSAPKKTNQ